MWAGDLNPSLFTPSSCSLSCLGTGGTSLHRLVLPCPAAPAQGHSWVLLQTQPQPPAHPPTSAGPLGPSLAVSERCRGQGDGLGGAAPLPCLCSASAACKGQEAASKSCKNLHVMARRHRKVAWWLWGDIQLTPAASEQAGLWPGGDPGHLPTRTSKLAKVALSLLSAPWDLALLSGDSRAQWGQQSSMGTGLSQDSVLLWYNPARFPFLRLWAPEPEGTAAELPTLQLCHVSAATLAPGGARLQLHPRACMDWESGQGLGLVYTLHREQGWMSRAMALQILEW